MKQIYKFGFILFTLFYLVFSSLRPQQALAEGNPFVPTTDVLNTGLTAQVGADELAQASTSIANFKDITGAYYDSTLNRIVFIGTTTGTNPNYNQDDVAVAVKTILTNGTLPSLSIDDDPNNPTSSTAIVNYTGSIQNTNFANDLFNGDYKLKQYAIGYDPSQHQVTSNVSTYKSVVNRYLALQSSPVAGNESKYIISPQSVTLKNSTTSNAFAFSNVTMQVTAQAVNQSNDSLWNQAANNFASDLTANYNQYSQETTSFTQAQQLAKIVAVIKWMTDNAIPSDALIAKNYTPGFISTPSTVQKVSTPTGGYTAQGSVNYNTPNTYIPDDGTAAGLKTSAQAGSSSNQDVTWTFTNGGQQYTAVAVAAGAFKSLGSYSTSINDFSLPITNDISLKFQRSYSSFSNGQNGIGLGWDFMQARLYNNSNVIDICSDFSSHYAKLAIDTQNGHETFTYSCSSNSYSPDDPSFHSTISNSNITSPGAITLSNQQKYNFATSSAGFQLTNNLDKNGNTINYSYDGSGKLTGIADTHSHSLTIAYNGQNLISSVTDWTNRKVQYSYDTNGRLTGVTDPNNNTTNYTYDSNGKLATVTDRTGQVVLTNTYNGDARLATLKNASNLLTTYTYDNVSKVITQTDSNNRVTKTTYDSNARILQQTDPAGKNIVYTYGSENVPLTQTDRSNNKKTFTYDSKGNMLSATFPDNSVINYTYDGNNRITKILDGRYNPTKETDFTYDSSGDLTQKTEASVSTNYTYDSTGKILTVTDPLNNLITWTRDSLGNPLTQKDPYNNITNFTYDSIGRLTQQKDPNNNTISYTYDANGNLLTKVDAIGTTTNIYDKENKLTKITLPNNAVTQYAYNTSGTISTATNALNNTTTYGYDNYQNLTSQQDALNHTTTNSYDLLNRPTQVSTPLGKVTKWTYDSNGNILSRIDANNKTTNYLYDSLNRLTKITYPDNSTITYQYDNRGNLTQMVDPNGTSTYTYDSFDRMTKATNQYSQSLQYTYDNANNLLTITYPDNKVVTYTYDKNNRMSSVKDWNNQTTNYTYNNNGTLATRALPNGITTYYSYDGASRLTTLEHKSGSTSDAKYVYQRDSVGNITSNVESGSFPAAQTDTFTYDNAGKITNGTYGYPSANITYTYDAVGNILTRVDPNHSSSTSYTYDADNRMTNAGGSSVSYDSNGNQLSEPYNSTTLTYNFENNLTKYTSTYGTDTYKYDGLGNRVEYDDQSGNQTRSITDTSGSLSHVLADYDLTFNKIKGWYVYGLGLISGWTNYSDTTHARYFLEDGMGNTRFTTDNTGSQTSTLSYDPFGQNTYSSGNGYGNTPVKKGPQPLSLSQNTVSPGYEFDQQHAEIDTGFYYLRARYYDPATQRFLTKDPLAGSLRNPLSQNAYQYGYDNPINLDDPSGRCLEDACVGEAIIAGTIIAEEGPQIQEEISAIDTNTPQAIGKAGEILANIIKNTERIPSLSNPGRYRIPDQLLRSLKLLSEVKNVKYLAYTNQLKDFFAWAQRYGFTFELFVRPNGGTTLSGPLQSVIDSGSIVLRFIGQK